MYMSNNIDKIFYINLDKRTDRKDEIENELQKMGLTAEIYPAIYTQTSERKRLQKCSYI